MEIKEIIELIIYPFKENFILVLSIFLFAGFVAWQSYSIGFNNGEVTICHSMNGLVINRYNPGDVGNKGSIAHLCVNENDVRKEMAYQNRMPTKPVIFDLGNKTIIMETN